MMDKGSFLYQEIAEALRRQIASGQLEPGERLPSMRALAEQWHCTPGTVSRAYSQLAEEGLVTAHRGSGTRVAPDALQPSQPAFQWASLVSRADQFLLEALSGGHTAGEAIAALSVAIARWEELQRRQPGDRPERDELRQLRFAGSHDLTVELVGRLLAEAKPALGFPVSYLGSLGGLMALARGEADVAGSHLWDEESDSYNRPFVRRLLPGRRCLLLTLARRSLGLIVAAGNPQGIRGLPDLTRPEIRFVNRQAGSGTRVWLDAQLQRKGLDAEAIQGYERELSTHTAVAHAIEEGEADAGLGIRAAAAAYDLDFVPLTWEQYDLVFPETVWQTAPAQNLAALIESDRFREAVTALGGYDTADTGQRQWT